MIVAPASRHSIACCAISAGVSGAVALTFLLVEPLIATSRITGVSSFLKEKLLLSPDVAGPATTRLAARKNLNLSTNNYTI
jgi:hypothetical protein